MWTLIIRDLKKDRVLDTVKVSIAQHDKSKRVMHPVVDYEDGPVSKQILWIILSYNYYLNCTVWSK